MKDGRSSAFCRPFENLGALLRDRSLPPAAAAARPPAKKAAPARPLDDNRLFREAMADVAPIRCNKYARCGKAGPSAPPPRFDADRETLQRLYRLVTAGEGFVVADTPEYMEGTGISAHPGTAARLHQGVFSIQGHIDLHGMGVQAAREAFNVFLKETIRSGKRAVLIVHGRGLSSPARPVLKTKVYEWLTHGPWRKWVIAFASARPHDGGAGATYVLLRQRPLTRRFRKKKSAGCS